MFPAWGIAVDWYVEAGNGFGKLLLMLTLWCRMSQGFTCLLIAVNRCSAILYPLDYERIWTRGIIIICVILQIFAGLPIAIVVDRQEMQWKINEAYVTSAKINYSDVIVAQEPQALKLVFQLESAKFLVFGVGFGVQFVFCFLLILCYLYMIYVFQYSTHSIRIHKPSTDTLFSPGSTVSQQRKTINQQLFKMASCVCTIEICFTIFMAVIFTVCSKCISPNVFYAVWDSLTILYSTAGAYILLLCSSYSRNLVVDTLNEVRTLFCGKNPNSKLITLRVLSTPSSRSRHDTCTGLNPQLQVTVT
uniref:7TM_GPCR_Srx domain-containing protein n=1 Tax=Panagrellus redivivus TaxID=6233 RepID=A0A7E4VQ10_PANRE